MVHSSSPVTNMCLLLHGLRFKFSFLFSTTNIISVTENRNPPCVNNNRFAIKISKDGITNSVFIWEALLNIPAFLISFSSQLFYLNNITFLLTSLVHLGSINLETRGLPNVHCKPAQHVDMNTIKLICDNNTTGAKLPFVQQQDIFPVCLLAVLASWIAILKGWTSLAGHCQYVWCNYKHWVWTTCQHWDTSCCNKVTFCVDRIWNSFFILASRSEGTSNAASSF